MKSVRNTRNALLAAASALAASAVLHPAFASDFDGAAPAATYEVQAADAGAVAAAQTDEKPAIGAKKWALVVAAAGALAALVKMIGAKRVAETVTAGAVSAARATARTASGAARIVGRTVLSPLKFLAVLFGLALFALTGIGLFDIEWIGGLLSGAALAGAGVYGFLKTRRIFEPAKARTRSVMTNEN